MLTRNRLKQAISHLCALLLMNSILCRCMFALGEQNGSYIQDAVVTNSAGQLRLVLGEFNLDGSLKRVLYPVDETAEFYVYSMGVRPDGSILAGGSLIHSGISFRDEIVRVSAEGVLDSAFTVTADGTVFCVEVQPDGKILVGGSFRKIAGEARHSIARLNLDGTLDSSFISFLADNEISDITRIAVLPDGKLLALGVAAYLAGGVVRLNQDGSLDETFHRPVTWPRTNSALGTFATYPESLVVQPDGKIIVAGSFAALSTFDATNSVPRPGVARFYPDGTLDDDFRPEIASTDDVYHGSIILQANGQIRLSRDPDTAQLLLNPDGRRAEKVDPSFESLTYRDSTITWLRGGAVVEVWRTTFEYSRDRTNWTLLGPGRRIPGGWELNHQELLAGDSIRARGYVPGAASGQASMVETTLHLTLQMAPFIRLSSNPRIPVDPLTLAINGLAGQTIVLEQSEDLHTWVPVVTNLLQSVTFQIQVTRPPLKAFYRIRLK